MMNKCYHYEYHTRTKNISIFMMKDHESKADTSYLEEAGIPLPEERVHVVEYRFCKEVQLGYDNKGERDGNDLEYISMKVDTNIIPKYEALEDIEMMERDSRVFKEISHAIIAKLLLIEDVIHDGRYTDKIIPYMKITNSPISGIKNIWDKLND